MTADPRLLPSRRQLLAVLAVLALVVAVPPPWLTPTAALLLRLVWAGFAVALLSRRRDAGAVRVLPAYAGGVWLVAAASGGALALAA